MMKKIRKYGLSVLLTLVICLLTACGGSGTSGESTAQTTAGEEKTTTKSGADGASESTGVIDGMVNDGEQGVDNAVDDVMGDRQMNGQDKSAQETTTGAQ